MNDERRRNPISLRFVAPFVVAGFLIGISLCGVAYYETVPTSPGYGTHPINEMVFVLLCPTSILTMADRLWKAELIIWCMAIVANAALYGVGGLIVGRFVVGRSSN